MRRNLTPYLKMDYFGTGQCYNIKADIERVHAIENSLDIAMKLTGGGVLSGWTVYQEKIDSLSDTKRFQLYVESGIGIVQFLESQNYNKSVDTGFSETIDINTPPSPHYLAIKTKNKVQFPNPSVGKNRISAVYVALNPIYYNKFEEIINLDIKTSVNYEIYDNVFVTIATYIDKWIAIDRLKDYYNEINVFVVPDPSEVSAYGLYKNSIPTEDKYPIYTYEIQGEIRLNVSGIDMGIYVFVNGKRIGSGYTVVSNSIITFDTPLSQDDYVTVLSVPQNGILLAEVETDENGIIRIDNSIRTSVYDNFSNDLALDYLSNHVHDGSSASKILLTTETSLLVSKTISDDRKTFVFSKDISAKYGFNFSKGTYIEDVYLDGLFSQQNYILTDNDTDKTISITFASPVQENVVVKLKLTIRNDYMQIINSLDFSDTNHSKEKIDIAIDATNITTGTINENKVPQLSHIGVVDKILKPCNFGDKEYVHNVESFDVLDKYRKEFFPVVNGKTNARNACFLIKDTDYNVIYTCASNDILYIDRTANKQEVSVSGNFPYDITYNDTLYAANGYLDGWNTSDLSSHPEYNKPFKMISVKNSVFGGNRTFAIYDKFVVALSFDSGNLKFKEVVNLSNDKNTNNDEITDVDFGEFIIKDACECASVLNKDYSHFCLLGEDGRVLLYDYSSNDKRCSFYDITSYVINSNENNKTWSGASRIFNVNIDGTDIVFVTTTDGKMYVNDMSYVRLSAKMTNGSTKVYGDFNVVVKGFYPEKNVIIATSNLISEVHTILNGQDYDISVGYGTSFDVDFVSNVFPGVGSNGYQSFAIKDWQLINGEFLEEIKKIEYSNGMLIVLTVSKIYYSSITSLEMFTDNFTITWNSIDINDFANDMVVAENYLIIICDGGIYRSQILSNSILSVEKLLNDGYAESLNSLLSSLYFVYYDGDLKFSENKTIYVCGKYGIFKSSDLGSSWRNTIQLLGNPVDKKSGKSEKEFIVTEIDQANKKIYVADYDYYYNLFGYDYGYGYGNGKFNPLEGINENDYIYIDETSSSLYKNIPLKIVGMGIEDEQTYFIVEQFNGDAALLDAQISVGQVAYVYKQISPLVIVDDAPQETNYNNNNPLISAFDYNRQSIIFDEVINLKSDIEICSRYKYFTTIDNEISLSDIAINSITNGIGLYNSGQGKIYIELNNNILSGWIKNDDIIVFDEYFNKEQVLKLTVTGTYLKDVGMNNSHEKIEDAISVEESGLTYGMESVRSSNFLSLLMATQHYFNSKKVNYSTNGIVGEIHDSDIWTEEPYIIDNNKIFANNLLNGKRIIINSSKSNTDIKFTVKRNHDNKIKINRILRSKHFVSPKTYYSFEDIVNPASVKVYVNNIEINGLGNWQFSPSESSSTMISFINPIFMENGNDVWISYYLKNEYVKLNDLFNVGDSYRIDISSNTITDFMSNIYVSMYRDEVSIIDYKSCYIENKIANNCDINDSYGNCSLGSYSIYNDSNNGVLYVGTNLGIWKKELHDPALKISGNLLSTIDATGDITFSDSISGIYIEFNKDTEKWSVIWGSGTTTIDENKNLGNVKINSIKICPNNSNIIIASSDIGIFRSVDAGVNWECVFDTLSDHRTKDFPIMLDITFDKKNPYIVNSVGHYGVYRSFNYGSSWTLFVNGDLSKNINNTYGYFSYIEDDSDSSSMYLFFQTSARYKHDSTVSGSFSKNSGDIYISRNSLFRKRITGDKINSFSNNIYNIGDIYFTSPYSGVFGSYLFGFGADVNQTSKWKSPGDNAIGYFEKGMNGLRNNNGEWSLESFIKDTSDIAPEIAKTQAFGDRVPDGLDLEMLNYDSGFQLYGFGYDVFFDYVNKKTYVSFDMDEGQNVVPKDGEAVGHYLALRKDDGFSYLKVIANYDRGYSPDRQHVSGYYNEKIGTKKVEFVLDGLVEDIGSSEKAYYCSGDNYKIARNTYSNNIYNSIYLSLIGERNGKISNLDLGKIGDRVYAVKDTIFGTDKTILIIDFYKTNNTFNIPSFITENSGINTLVGYEIGENNQGYNYKIVLSEPLSNYPNSSYYIYSDDIIQYVCALDDVPEFQDPKDLWIRMDHTEMHNTEAYICKIYDENNDIISPIQYSRVVYSDYFTGNEKENVIWVGVKDLQENNYDNAQWNSYGYGYDEIPTYLIGKYIGNSASDVKYKILDVKLDSGISYGYGYTPNDWWYNDGYFESLNGGNTYGYFLRVEPYSRSYINDAKLYSNSIVSSISLDGYTISFVNGGNLEVNSLIGFYIKKQGTNMRFLIQSNTSDSITTNEDMSSVFFVNDEFKIDYSIFDSKCNSIYVNGISDQESIIYVASSYSFYESNDGGLTWRSRINGLPFNSTTKKTKVNFSKIRFIDGFIYGVSSNENDGGIWRLDISLDDNIWGKIIDSNGEDLSSIGAYDVDVVGSIVYAADIKRCIRID